MILHKSACETIGCKIIDVTNIVYITHRVYFYSSLKSFLCVGFKQNSPLILIDQEETVLFELQNTEIFRNQ